MKKFVSLMLALLLVVSMAPAALAASDLPAPVASFGFEAEEGMTIVGGSLVADAERGQVLTLTGGAKHASYATIDTDLFSTTEWTDGMTIAFWVKAADANPGIAPLYSFNIADSGSEGYIATTDSLEIAINSDGNSGNSPYPRVWADPSVVDATAQPVLTAGKWQHVAVTLAASGMTIYLDGEVYANPVLGPSSANFKMFLSQLQYIYGVQLGNWNCGWWDDIGAFAGSFDDVHIFNSALSQDEVKAVMAAEFGDFSGGANTVVIVAGAAVAVIAVAAVVVLLKKKKSAK